jgi:hypothetical protein
MEAIRRLGGVSHVRIVTGWAAEITLIPFSGNIDGEENDTNQA